MQDFNEYLDGSYVFLDTETTGTSSLDEVIELGIVDVQGNVVYSSLFCPEVMIQPMASSISGIFNEDLINEPQWMDEWENILKCLNGKKVLAYNTKFDERLFYQTCMRYGLDSADYEYLFNEAADAMVLYTKYISDLPQNVNIRLQDACCAEGINLVQDHRATGDCKMMLELLKKMADPCHESSFEQLKKVLPDKKLAEINKKSNQLKQNHKFYTTTEKKIPNQEMYEILFDEGKTVAEIAAFQDVKPATVESHLVQLFLKGKNVDIEKFINKDYEMQILDIARKYPKFSDYSLTKKIPIPVSTSCVAAIRAKDSLGLYPELQQSEPSLDSEAKDMEQAAESQSKGQSEREVSKDR